MGRDVLDPVVVGLGVRDMTAARLAMNRAAIDNSYAKVSIDIAIGNAANVQFVLAAPSVTLPYVIPVSAPSGRHPCKVAGNHYIDDILAEPMQVRDGAMLSLDATGLGIETDEAKMGHYRQGLG